MSPPENEVRVSLPQTVLLARPTTWPWPRPVAGLLDRRLPRARRRRGRGTLPTRERHEFACGRFAADRESGRTADGRRTFRSARRANYLGRMAPPDELVFTRAAGRATSSRWTRAGGEPAMPHRGSTAVRRTATRCWASRSPDGRSTARTVGRRPPATGDAPAVSSAAAMVAERRALPPDISENSVFAGCSDAVPSDRMRRNRGRQQLIARVRRTRAERPATRRLTRHFVWTVTACSAMSL